MRDPTGHLPQSFLLITNEKYVIKIMKFYRRRALNI